MSATHPEDSTQRRAPPSSHQSGRRNRSIWRGAADGRILAEWVVAIVSSLTAALVTPSGGYHQFAIGLTLSVLSLFVGLTASETFFRWVELIAGAQRRES